MLIVAGLAIFASSCKKEDPSIAATGIDLDRSKVSLEIGQTASLTATVRPRNATDKTVVWSSDDESIASVDQQGLVTGVAEGETTITATVSSNPELKSSCKVSVTKQEEPVEEPVTEVYLSKTSAVIGVKDTLMLAPYVVGVSYLEISFAVSDGKNDVVKIERVNGPGIGSQAIIGVAAGTAQVIGTYVSKENGTETVLTFDVKVEDSFKAYVSDVFSVTGRGTVLRSDEVLSGVITNPYDVDILQPFDTYTDLSSTVVALSINAKAIDKLSAGDENVAFLMRGLDVNAVATGAVMMTQGTEHIVAVKKVTGILYIPERGGYVTKGYSPILKFSHGVEIPVTMTDTGLPETMEDQSLETWQMHQGVEMEASETSRIICSLGQTFDVYENGEKVGKFMVTDYEKAE